MGEDFTRITTFVDSGIYSIVRHPLHLGWSLMYVSVIFFSQHGLILIMGFVGIACMVLITKQENKYLIEKFGNTYAEYIKSVPAINVLAGIIRALRHK